MKMNLGACCAVTVTYGRRAPYVEKVVEAAIGAGAASVVLVDNGSRDTNRQALNTLAEKFHGRVILHRLEANLGSAGGFKAGIEQAIYRGNCRFLWLLDDDNVPAEDALSELKHPFSSLADHMSMDRLAVSALRSDLAIHRRLAAGGAVGDVYKWPSSFMGFHLGKTLKRFLRVPAGPVSAGRNLVDIPYGPYGGLFFERRLIDRIGLPDPSLFLYGDDREYTHRIIQMGGRLVLVCRARITDIVTSWATQARRPSILFSDDELRVYYNVRNHVYFDYHFWRRRRFIYKINKGIVMSGLWLLAAARRRLKRLELIKTAVRNGETSNLGESPMPHLEARLSKEPCPKARDML